MPFADRINGIPVIQTWPKGISFVRADLVVDVRNNKVIEDLVVLQDNVYFFRKDPMGGDPKYAGKILQPSPRFVRKLKEFKQTIAHLENIRLGVATAKLNHREPFRSAVGNLITDAMRAVDPSINLAIINYYGIRANIPKGIINYGRLFEVLPFDNTLVTLKLTGAQIKAILERGLSHAYGVMQISGLKVTVDLSKSPGQRCIAIKNSAGDKLVETKLYRVATNEFLIKGGDGHQVFAQGIDIHDTKRLLREIVADYIKKKGRLIPSEEQRYLLKSK